MMKTKSYHPYKVHQPRTQIWQFKKFIKLNLTFNKLNKYINMNDDKQ